MEQRKQNLKAKIVNLKKTHPSLIQFSKPQQKVTPKVQPNIPSTILSVSTTIAQTDVDGYTFPVIVNGGSEGTPTVITFAENLTFGDVNDYFIVNSDYVTFDGMNYDVILQISGADNFYNGLIQNGTGYYDGSNGISNNDAYDYLNVKNINVIVDYTFGFVGQNFEYGQESGWICQPYFAVGKSNCYVCNCSSNGWITGGGIVGCFSWGNIDNCFSIGPIGLPIIQLLLNNTENISSGEGEIVIDTYDFNFSFFFAGGICGHDCSNMTITNCFSGGRIRLLSGGICGSLCNVIINNSYALGNVEVLAGGLVGAGSECDVTNCYSNQDITPYSGSIYGAECIGTCTNCYTSTYYENNVPIIFCQFGSSDGQNIVNCYSYSNSWNNGVANSLLLNECGEVWTQINCNANPFLLTSFKCNNYETDHKRIKSGKYSTSEPAKFSDTNYLIVDINCKSPSRYPKISIDNNTGVLTFDRIEYDCGKCHNDYDIRVLSYQLFNGEYFNYQISCFKLHVSRP